jgi:hypothetical protein
VLAADSRVTLTTQLQPQNMLLLSSLDIFSSQGCNFALSFSNTPISLTFFPDNLK